MNVDTRASISMFDLREIIETDIEVLKILDVGAMLEGTTIYDNLLKKGLAQVIGFEPNPIEYERLCREKKNCQWLPYFLGDGNPATFYITRYPGCSSLYAPNPEIIDLFHSINASEPNGNFTVIDTKKVKTKRLDDIEECKSNDFIKIDVQGSELDILRNAKETLGNTLIIQLEAEFIPIYKNQPLFGELQVFLRDQGFQLHKFIDIAGRCFNPFQLKNPFAAMSQALWTDAIFVRDFTLLDQLSETQLLKAATILHEIYHSYDFAMFFLNSLDDRNNSNFGRRYQTALREYPLSRHLFMNLKENIE